MKHISAKLLALSLLFSLSTKAQDIHFSQHYFSPLTEDPALTGDMDGTYRFGAIYRSQWGSITGPFVYQTPSIYGDFDLFKGSNSGSNLGIGALIVQDKQGDGNLTNTTAEGSLAWHQSVDGTGNYLVSLGIQAGYVQMRIDPTALSFYDQWNGLDFSHFATGDVVGPSLGYVDVNAGLGFSAIIGDNSRATLGFGAFHLNSPKESFLNGSTNVTNIRDPRYVAHAASSFMIDHKIFLYPNISYALQGADQELTIGSLVGINFSQSRYHMGTIGYAGILYRSQDAIIPTVGFIMQGLQFGIAYDVNISSLNVASGGQGAYEIGVRYVGAVEYPKKQKHIFCPRM